MDNEAWVSDCDGAVDDEDPPQERDGAADDEGANDLAKFISSSVDSCRHWS